MIEELDDLTLVYMYGAKNGRDSMKDEIERLRAALRQLAEIDKIENGFIRIKEVIHYTRFMARAALEGEKTND
jgi:hypothetical protein